MSMRMKKGLSIAVVSTLIGVILGTMALYGKADACLTSKIETVSKGVFEKETKSYLRDLRILARYNKKKAMQTKEDKKLWNESIDEIDNSGVTK